MDSAAVLTSDILSTRSWYERPPPGVTNCKQQATCTTTNNHQWQVSQAGASTYLYQAAMLCRIQYDFTFIWGNVILSTFRRTDFCELETLRFWFFVEVAENRQSSIDEKCLHSKLFFFHVKFSVKLRWKQELEKQAVAHFPQGPGRVRLRCIVNKVEMVGWLASRDEAWQAPWLQQLVSRIGKKQIKCCC